jgi:hypothetical protein
MFFLPYRPEDPNDPIKNKKNMDLSAIFRTLIYTPAETEDEQNMDRDGLPKWQAHSRLRENYVVESLLSKTFFRDRVSYCLSID